MVAINKIILTLTVSFIAPVSVLAQQVQPRIAGLETNPKYISLLGEDNILTQREDSITVVVNSLREAFRNNAENSADSHGQIISLENQLFELRARKAMVVDSLNIIEQDWVINNNMVAPELPSQGQAELVDTSIDAKFIYESPNVVDNLSSVDYRNLVKAEELEIEAEKLSQSYAVNYENLLSLKRSYESAAQRDEAFKIKQQFNLLHRENIRISEELNDTWGFIYDNKSFAYSVIMELLGFADVLQQEAELMRQAQAEISMKQGGGSDELMRYLVQKNSMVGFELLVANQLGLNIAADSLKVIDRKLSSIDKTSLPKISLEERLFIVYEPIEFVSSALYTASNPIPTTEIYESGVIFRIYVGSFQTKPAISTFRNTIPISYLVNDEKRYCYYIGGFATYDQAVEAFESLKNHGFRSPQIVVWCDGRERNLTKEPLQISLETTYRVEISERQTLPDGATEVVGELSGGSPISKVGTDKFVITSLRRRAQVDSLVGGLQALDPQLKISVEKSVPKVEF